MEKGLDWKKLEQALDGLVLELKPVEVVPGEEKPFESVTFDGTEEGNERWWSLFGKYLETAETFAIHCWNEETEWIDLALQYGEPSDEDWKYGKIITGPVTEAFKQMLRSQAKPEHREIYNKMTPFFQIFLDDTFQSCHYGTENYYR